MLITVAVEHYGSLPLLGGRSAALREDRVRGTRARRRHCAQSRGQSRGQLCESTWYEHSVDKFLMVIR